jgi:cytochrome c peroxidase
MKNLLAALLTLIAFLSTPLPAAADEALIERANTIFKPIPETPSQLTRNPLTPDKIELGKMLYFEPRLSKSALISCNTCHNIGLGGADFQQTSTGHAWQQGDRNSPTVFNSVYNIAQFWDGRAKNLLQQAKGPVQAGVEMNNTPEQVVKTLKSMPEYMQRFSDAFPGESKPVTFDNMARAIEAFEATLITPGAPFDRFLLGDANALTSDHQEGLRTFMDKGCAACHGGINMGGSGYFPFGVIERPAEDITGSDKGRFTFTGSASDQYVFKSPSLRNIELTTPYFHSGKVWCLKKAIAIMGSAQLGISLNEADVLRIETFLKATTGIQPQITYPILPAPTNTTPLPALD